MPEDICQDCTEIRYPSELRLIVYGLTILIIEISRKFSFEFDEIFKVILDGQGLKRYAFPEIHGFSVNKKLHNVATIEKSIVSRERVYVMTP